MLLSKRNFPGGVVVGLLFQQLFSGEGTVLLTGLKSVDGERLWSVPVYFSFLYATSRYSVTLCSSAEQSHIYIYGSAAEQSHI